MTLFAALTQLLVAAPLVVAWTVICGLGAALWLRELRTPALLLGAAGATGLFTVLGGAVFHVLFMAMLQESYNVTDGVLTTERWLTIAQAVWALLSVTRLIAHLLLVAAVFVGRQPG